MEQSSSFVYELILELNDCDRPEKQAIATDAANAPSDAGDCKKKLDGLDERGGEEGLCHTRLAR